MITATSNIVDLRDYELDIITIIGKNTVQIEVTDKRKYAYEKGYKKMITRKMSHQGVISFDNQGIHLAELQGVKQFLENFKKPEKKEK